MPEETLKNIPKSDVGEYVQECVNDGATKVVVTKQSDGRYTVVATYPD